MSLPAGYRERRLLMDGSKLKRTLSRMAHEIAERQDDLERTVFVGVRSRGVPLAHRLAGALHHAAGVHVRVGALDIALYRDDVHTLAAQPILRGTDIPFSIDGRTVVLVDDVLFTGRTVRAALDELIDFGRPARIELCVLVDRGHRELPIRADYVGATILSSRAEVVQVQLLEEDGEDRVSLLGPSEPAPAKSAARKPAKRPAPGRKPRR